MEQIIRPIPSIFYVRAAAHSKVLKGGGGINLKTHGKKIEYFNQEKIKELYIYHQFQRISKCFQLALIFIYFFNIRADPSTAGLLNSFFGELDLT